MIFKDDPGCYSKAGFSIIHVAFSVSAVRKQGMSSSELFLL
jgi:hypothetical protein